ncbi:conserved hypothetical protein [Ricinus communis]|uniref:Uncharacterized protein n=1 Tax=Ricinus communis TaxID=3988 RepID=B9RFN4_RICCO|nr:conserved hypothetical protein [Ricinus communis]
MTRAKVNGGMGFRDLKTFNTALLGNQAWRLVNRPESLCYQIYRTLYFPHTSFWMPRKWSEGLIRNLFMDIEADAILQIPIGPSNVNGRFIWHFDRMGRVSHARAPWFASELGLRMEGTHITSFIDTWGNIMSCFATPAKDIYAGKWKLVQMINGSHLKRGGAR